MNPDAAQRLGQFVIVGDDGSTVAKTTEGFGGEKTGRGGKGQCSEPPALVVGPKGLRGVIENEQALGGRDRPNRVMISTLSEQIDGHDRFWFETKPARGSNTALERGWSHVECRFIDIDEHWRRARQRHGLARRTERKRRTEYRVATADALSHQHHQ